MVADNNNVVLFDCGHDAEGFRPSVYLPQNWRAVQQLVVSHYDSDHVSDLANLRTRMPIERCSRTLRSVSMKSAGSSCRKAR